MDANEELERAQGAVRFMVEAMRHAYHSGLLHGTGADGAFEYGSFVHLKEDPGESGRKVVEKRLDLLQLGMMAAHYVHHRRREVLDLPSHQKGN